MRGVMCGSTPCPTLISKEVNLVNDVQADKTFL